MERKWEAIDAKIISSKKDASKNHPYNKDLMDIIAQCDDWEIKIFLIDQGSTTYILYKDSFERLHLNVEDLKIFHR